MKNKYGQEIDLTDLQKVYASNALVSALFNHLRVHANNSMEVLTAEDLQKSLTKAGINVDYVTARLMLQTLKERNIGEFKAGRRGQKTRFIFWVPPRSLAMAITDEPAIMQHLLTPPPPAPLAAAALSPENPMRTHKLWLRPDLEIAFQLPADFSESDVARLTDFIKKLPFDRSALRIAA